MSIDDAIDRIATSCLYVEAWTTLGSGETVCDTLLVIGEEYKVLEAIADEHPETAALVKRVLEEWQEYAARFQPYLH